MKLKSRIKILAVCAVAIVVGVGGFVSQTYASNQVIVLTNHHKLTAKDLKELEDVTTAIDTKYGEFKRVSKAVPMDPSEIVHKSLDINATTKEVILDYGVFIKE